MTDERIRRMKQFNVQTVYQNNLNSNYFNKLYFYTSTKYDINNHTKFWFLFSDQ